VRRFYVVSLGCPKNTVDSEAMSQLLQARGWRPADHVSQADLVVVNTCGFITDAREESYRELAALAADKRRGQRLLAAGCLAELCAGEIQRRVAGVDGVLGTRQWPLVAEIADALMDGRALDRRPQGASIVVPVQRSAQGATAYLKIADGCDAGCAFCAIPLIKGPQCSKDPQAVLTEAVELSGQGVKELILIAQDSTAYGRDLDTSITLAELTRRILQVAPGLAWLRIMYAYPQHVTDELIEAIASYPQICHYLDLPLQHVHPAVLRRMRRSPDVTGVRRLIARLRKAVPDIALRTAFIVGYPGETEEEFAALLTFLEEIRFDKVGIFAYSPEKDTPAIDLPHQVPPDVKEARLEEAMSLQRDISLQRNEEQVGRQLGVLIEGASQGISVGRTYRDAPEIDGYVVVRSEEAVGEITMVEIEAAMDYDLQGRALDPR